MDAFTICADSYNPNVLFHYLDDAGYEMKEHSHDFLMLYYAPSGSCTVMIDHTDYQLEQGDIAVISAHHLHGHRKSQSPIFHLGYENLYVKGCPVNSLPVDHPVVTPKRYARQIYSCYRAIMEEQSEKEAGWELMTRVKSIEFLTWLIKEIMPQESPKLDQYIQLKMYDKGTIARMITAYFKENYMKKISVEELSHYTYLSTTYVTKIFKEETGSTPINYLISIRMNKAKDLLQDQTLSVKEVAKSVGYDDPYYFSKLFKKHCGISPTLYRKEGK